MKKILAAGTGRERLIGSAGATGAAAITSISASKLSIYFSGIGGKINWLIRTGKGDER